MLPNLIPIKTFLGKYYQELAYSSVQPKYSKSNLTHFFDQRFLIQNNKTQMIVDPTLRGLIVIISGNEVLISKDMYDHPNIEVVNSMENQDIGQNNPKSLYDATVFSTISYLICQNHTMFRIVGEVDEPIYIRHKSDYETFYSSVVVFNVSPDINIEIVEEFESYCALNSVTNYILQNNSQLNLSTFYQNHKSALSFCLRNVIVQDYAKYTHFLFGKGSSSVIDESKIMPGYKSSIELLGCINSDQHEFHKIVGVQPVELDYNFLFDHRHVVYGKGKVTFTPVIVGQLPPDSHTNIESLDLGIISEEDHLESIGGFLVPIIERATLERTIGVERFYSNKSKFLHF